MKRVLKIVLVCFVVLLLGSMASAKSSTYPDFPMINEAGTEILLSDLNTDKPMVINFWAEWCPPCMKEMPEFAEVYDNHTTFCCPEEHTCSLSDGICPECGQALKEKNDFVFVSVAVKDSDALKTWKKNRYNWIYGYDITGKGGKTYKVKSIPHTIFIDKTGKIVKKVTGSMSKEEFEKNLKGII